MFIYGTSDLHLDINRLYDPIPFYGKDSVLLIAGDTAEIASLRKKGRTYMDLEAICQAFGQVYAITGNHEYYQGILVQDSKDGDYADVVKDIPNLKVLNNDVVIIDDKVRLIASTMWTDFHKGDPSAIDAAWRGLNDYNYIMFQEYVGALSSTLKPTDIYKIFAENEEFIRNEIEKDGSSKATIIMTHHAPIMAHCNSQRHSSSLVDYAYACTVFDDFIVDNSADIDVWFHGHTHDHKQTQIDNTRIVTKARGYNDPQFDPVLLLETV
jgi:predicted phosphohydrolase